MYYDDEQDDKKDINKLDTYEEENEDDGEDDESEDDSSQDSSGGMEMPGKGGNGLGKFASKAFSGIGKAVAKFGKLIAVMPLPFKIAIIAVIIGIITFLIMEVTKVESSAQVNNSVNNTITKNQNLLNGNTSSNTGTSDNNTSDGNTTNGETLTQEQKDKIQKALDFYEENNSFLYFTIDLINESYEDFVSENKNATGDVSKRVYDSLSTEFGNESIEDDSSRIVNINQKQALYKHLLMTEKYDFNKIQWKRYGHGYNGEDSPMTEDKELGLKYPNDGVNKIDTFISLASPYMLTWHIPLGFHSGYIAKSGSRESASKFTYSIIKEASSEIVAHRYDLQKYILNTKFNDYIKTEYKTRFSTRISVVYTYTAQVTEVSPPEITDFPVSTSLSWSDTGIVFFSGSAYTNEAGAIMRPATINGNSNIANVINTEIRDIERYDDHSQNNVVIYPGQDAKSRIISLADEFNLIEGDNQIRVLEFRTVDSNSSGSSYAGGSGNKKLQRTTYTCILTKNTSDNFVTNSDGDVIYDKTVKYEYTNSSLQEPSVLSTEYVNERLDENEEVDPMLEEEVNSSITIDNRYYISKAKTFDVEIANTFNYVKYSETNAANRIKPKRETETKVEDYYKVENEENKLDMQTIRNRYLTTSIANIENYFDVESKVLNSSTDGNSSTDDLFNQSNNSTTNTPGIGTGILNSYNSTTNNNSITNNIYNSIKLNSPGVSVPLGTEELDNKGATFTEVYTYSMIYKNKNSYIVKEGKAEEGQGTHYIQRQWEDRLTQLSSVTTAYDEEDLIDFNAEYNAELNGTTIDEEKEAFEEKADRAETNYSEYKGLAVQKLLNTIEFVNSNENMFKEYMDDMSPQSKIRGYSRSYIEFCMEEVKRLFKETENKNGTIPYVYGVSLGFTNVLENSNLNKISNSGGMFLWPVEQNEYVAFIYGYTPAYGINPHTGIDISYPADYEVRASASGTVIEICNSRENDYRDTSSFGNYIKIDHGNGYCTLYAHLLKNTSDDAIDDFVIGSTIEKGQIIGYTGSTGYSTGTHLHYEIRYDENGDGAFTESERIDPLEFFVVEPTSENIPEYDELLTNYELRYEISEGMINPYKFVGYPYNADGMDLSRSEFTKEEFVSLAEKNLSNVYGLTSDMEFYKELGNMYDYCQEVGVNPEYAVMTAVLEHRALDGYGVHNYWNIGVGNHDSPTVEGANSSFEEALAEFCEVILAYRDPTSSSYASIMARYEEREAAGCNPEGYGTPDTLAGIQSIYSWLGSDHTGDNAGTGGMYYINIPGVIYETQEEIEEKCWSKHGTAGGQTSTEPTTIEEQNNYTAYGVREKLKLRNTIFEY